MIVESYEDVIRLSGALRQNFWETIHTAISLTLKRHPSGVIIDCSQLTECTAQGTETFRNAMEFIQAKDARVIVAAVPDNIMEVLRSVPDVRSQLPIAATVEEARHSLNLLGEEEGKRKRRPSTSQASNKLLVCLSGSDADDWLLRVANDYGHAINAEANLIFPVLVPRHLPLQALLPDEEAAAAACLEKAQQYLESRQMPTVVRLERARDTASAIMGALEEVAASQVLVTIPDDPSGQDNACKVLKALLAKVDVPVMFVRGKA